MLDSSSKMTFGNEAHSNFLGCPNDLPFESLPNYHILVRIGFLQLKKFNQKCFLYRN